jgi:hypothetical protein
MASITVYPDPGSGATTADSAASRNAAASVWGDLVTGVGTSVNSMSGSDITCTYISSHAASSRWQELSRGLFTFDTSALGASATITSATLSLKGSSKSDANSITPNLNIYTHASASNNDYVAADFQTVGSTAQCDTAITYSGWSTSGYNDFALNATGRGNISKTGISKFSTRNANYDAINSDPTWNGGGNVSDIRCDSADVAGTATDPKLVVVYTAILTTSVQDSFSLSETVSAPRALVSSISDNLGLTGSTVLSLIMAASVTDTVSMSEDLSATAILLWSPRTKPSTSWSVRSGQSTSWTNRTKPTTNYTIRIKPS